MNGSNQFSWNSLDTDITLMWTIGGVFVGSAWPYFHEWLLSIGGWWPPIVAGAVTGAWCAAKRYAWSNPDPKV